MSLVVAKKYANQICVVSDTFLHNPENLNQIELNASEHHSLIKTIILNPYISISYAGDVEPAKEALNVCSKLYNKIAEIIQHLLNVNKASNGKTEFILCINLPPFYIYEIKDSRSSVVDSAWIGSKEGFNEFQKSFLAKDENKRKLDLYSEMQDAFFSVIESDIKEVSGFTISVTNENSMLQYKGYIKTYMQGQTFTGTGLHAIDIYGNAHLGSYTINMFIRNDNRIIAIHVRQNKYGIIYILNKNGFFETSVHRNVDQNEFIAITSSQFNLNPPYRIPN